ncbi:MAG: type II secretion system F family protein [Pirellulales bacterium]|nr:type II secretion system F family protein [Pirellulales bacterium]
MSNAGSVTLEHLTALTDEMAALVRAGVPLEEGLKALASQLPGRPGRLAELLAIRMEAGESLAQILADADCRFPPVWRSVVAAGLRSGHLSAALESLASTARRTAEVRKLVGAGILYPGIVLVIAFALFVFLILNIAPVMSQARHDLTGGPDLILDGLDWLRQTFLWWAIPIPLIGIILLGWWWYCSGRVLWSRRETARPWQWLCRGAGIGQTVHNSRMAMFAEIMALLVKQQIPMHESVALAAEVSGGRQFLEASHRMADLLQRGEVLTRREDIPAGFPPLLGWLMMSNGRQPNLGDTLSRTASVYRRRAEDAAIQVAIYLPMILTALVGGTATFLCGLVVFVPFARILYSLAGF